MEIYIHPGEYHFSTSDEVIRTVLGSCLTITMRCERVGVSAFTHAQLPSAPTESENEYTPFKYVDSAIREMYSQLAKYKITKSEIEVKVIGGGDVLEFINRGRPTVGRQNIETALKTLEELELSVTAMDIGGAYGRKVIYYTETGLVHVSKIKKSLMLYEK